MLVNTTTECHFGPNLNTNKALVIRGVRVKYADDVRRSVKTQNQDADLKKKQQQQGTMKNKTYRLMNTTDRKQKDKGASRQSNEENRCTQSGNEQTMDQEAETGPKPKPVWSTWRHKEEIANKFTINKFI